MSAPEKLMDRILSFVDQNGQVLSRHGTPFSGSLSMQFKSDDMNITMRVNEHAMGNGHCTAKVRVRGKLVYDGSGSYIARAVNVTAKVYKPGPWMKKLNPPRGRNAAYTVGHQRTSGE